MTRLFVQKGVVVAASFDKDAIIVFGSLPIMLIFVANVFATILILFRHPWATRNVIFARSNARVGGRRRFGAPHLRGGGQIVVVVVLILLACIKAGGAKRGKLSGINHIDEVARVDPTRNVREALGVYITTS